MWTSRSQRLLVPNQGQGRTKIGHVAEDVAADRVGEAGAVIAISKLRQRLMRKSTGNSIRLRMTRNCRRRTHDRQISSHRVTRWTLRMTRKVSFADARVVPDAVVNVKLCRSKTSRVAGSVSHRKVPVRPLPAMTIPSPIDRVDATNRVDVIAVHAASVRSRLVAKVRAASPLEAKLGGVSQSVVTRAVATAVDRIEARAHPATELASQQQDRFPALKRDARKVYVAMTISSSSMTTMSTVLAAA